MLLLDDREGAEAVVIQAVRRRIPFVSSTMLLVRDSHIPSQLARIGRGADGIQVSIRYLGTGDDHQGDPVKQHAGGSVSGPPCQ